MMSQRLSYSIAEAQSALSLGKTKIYALISSGDLRAKKIGKRTIILREDLADFLNRLTAFPTKNGGGHD